MSVKIYGGQHSGPINEIKRPQRSQPTKQTDKAQLQDQVNFSAVLKDVSQAKSAPGSASAERLEKVNTLKEQVASGSYQPDLQKVAASLLRFLVEEK